MVKFSAADVPSEGWGPSSDFPPSGEVRSDGRDDPSTFTRVTVNSEAESSSGRDSFTLYGNREGDREGDREGNCDRNGNGNSVGEGNRKGDESGNINRNGDGDGNRNGDGNSNGNGNGNGDGFLGLKEPAWSPVEPVDGVGDEVGNGNENGNGNGNGSGNGDGNENRDRDGNGDVKGDGNENENGNRDGDENRNGNGNGNRNGNGDGDGNEEEEDVCRICRTSGEINSPLYYPCACSGSIKYVHQECLLQWLNHSNTRHCEVCKHPFSFSPVYAENAPSRLPFQELVLGAALKAGRGLRFSMRLFLVLSVWLLFIPFTTCWLWRLTFVRTFQEAQNLVSVRFTPVLLLTDCVYGSFLSAGIVFVFLCVSSLRDYFRHLHEHGNENRRENEEGERIRMGGRGRIVRRDLVRQNPRVGGGGEPGNRVGGDRKSVV